MRNQVAGLRALGCGRRRSWRCVPTDFPGLDPTVRRPHSGQRRRRRPAVRCRPRLPKAPTRWLPCGSVPWPPSCGSPTAMGAATPSSSTSPAPRARCRVGCGRWASPRSSWKLTGRGPQSRVLDVDTTASLDVITRLHPGGCGPTTSTMPRSGLVALGSGGLLVITPCRSEGRPLSGRSPRPTSGVSWHAPATRPGARRATWTVTPCPHKSVATGRGRGGDPHTGSLRLTSVGDRRPVTEATLLDGARIVVGLLVLAAIFPLLQEMWTRWRQSVWLSWVSLGGAFLLALVAPWLTLVGWRVLLADLGTPLPLPSSASVFFVRTTGDLPARSGASPCGGQTGAWVPRRTLRGRAPQHRARCPTGTLVGLPAVPLCCCGAPPEDAVSPWWVVLAILLAVVVLWPRCSMHRSTEGCACWGRQPLPQPLGACAGHHRRVLRRRLGARWAAAWVLGRGLAPDVEGRTLSSSRPSAGSASRPPSACSRCSFPARIPVSATGCSSSCWLPFVDRGGHRRRRRAPLPVGGRSTCSWPVAHLWARRHHIGSGER